MAGEGQDIVRVGKDVADHRVARGGVRGEALQRADEGRVLQRHDGRIGDHALLQLVLFGVGRDPQRIADGRAVGEHRGDGARLAHVGGVGAGLLHHIVREHGRSHRNLGLHGRWRRRGRRLLLAAKGKGRRGAGGAQREDHGRGDYSKAWNKGAGLGASHGRRSPGDTDQPTF